MDYRDKECVIIIIWMSNSSAVKNWHVKHQIILSRIKLFPQKLETKNHATDSCYKMLFLLSISTWSFLST